MIAEYEKLELATVAANERSQSVAFLALQKWGGSWGQRKNREWAKT